MPQTSRLDISGQIIGAGIHGVVKITSDGGSVHTPDLLTSQAGTLSTRSTDTAGTLTLESEHGITTGQKIDIYWAATGIAYDVTVGTVAGLSVPFTLASGAILPVVDSVIQAAPIVVVTEAFAGDDMLAIAAIMPARGRIAFYETGDAFHIIHKFVANEPYQWWANNGFTNPLASKDIVDIRFSNQSSATVTAKIGIAVDSAT